MAGSWLRWMVLLALVAGLTGRVAQAKSPPSFTTIVVTDMHCAACAKRIAGRLYALKGVLEVRADVAKNSTYVIPQQQTPPAPRAMWEAVEAAGFQVVRMSGPAGEFTSKPKS